MTRPLICMRETRTVKIMSAIAGIFLLGVTAQSACAAELPPANASFRYTVINQDLSDVLKQFGDNIHVRVNVSDAISGRVRGRLSATSARQFLDLITSEYGIDWYYDSYALFLTTNGESVSRVVPLPAVGFEAFVKGLAKTGVLDRRFPLRVLPDSDDVLVSGPPRYVDLVERTASAMSPPKGPGVPEWAAESAIIYRGSNSQRIDFPRQ